MKFAKEVCQSCGSPILKDFDKGTEMSGVASDLYCRRCYYSGVFSEPTMTAEKMREVIQHKMIEMKFPRFLAVLLANRVYSLKRWELIKVH